MLEGLAHGALDRFAFPSSNKPGEVAQALEALAHCTEANHQDVYHRLLSATGNNHAGSYYPVVVPAIAFLGEILEEGSPVAKVTTLDVLMDLLASFGPEPGFEVI